MKYEDLTPSEQDEHGIVSPKEIISVLKHIAENGTRVALYFIDGGYFIMTTLLGVNEKGPWLEQSSNPIDNKRILESDELVIVSIHLNVKVQFAARQARSVEYQGYSAFHLPLPKCIYRLQRRDSFRLDIMPVKPLHCTIKTGGPAPDATGESKPVKTCEVAMMDISAGGMKLTFTEGDIELVQGQAYENCQIKLPEMGTISVTMVVRSLFAAPAKSGKTIVRAGCQFINLSNAASILLQRYINSMQRTRNTP